MRNSNKTVGILAIQGDFSMHAKTLERIGAARRWVKSVRDLDDIDALILPGGESTTMLKFLSDEGLRDPIRTFAGTGKPVMGTCAGAILLAKEVLNPPQESLQLLDITIERNAYGRQIESSIRLGQCPGLSDHPVEMVFIRAPIVRRMGKGVRVLGHSDDLPVLVEQGRILASTFHPELTEDDSIHRYFLAQLNR